MTKPPKPAKDAYGHYFKANLYAWAEAHSDVTSTEEVNAALKADYEALNDEGKAPYIAKAEEDAERYAAELAGWEAFKAKGKGGAKGAKKAGESPKKAADGSEE